MPEFEDAGEGNRDLSAFFLSHRPPLPPPSVRHRPPLPPPPVPHLPLLLLFTVTILLILPLGLNICLYFIMGLCIGLALAVLSMGDDTALLRIFLTVGFLFASGVLLQALAWILTVGLLGF